MVLFFVLIAALESNMNHRKLVRSRKNDLEKKEVKFSYFQVEKKHPYIFKLLWLIYVAAGLIVMAILGHAYAVYCRDVHDAHLWFSNIKVII